VAPLKRALVAGALLVSGEVHASPVDRWQPLIDEAAQRFEVSDALIRSVMRAESDGLTTVDGKAISSPAGAMGLMQLMPATWADMRSELGLGDDPYDPHDNILAGTFYLKQLRDRFGYPGMIAAYNAGPERYAAYLAGQRRLPHETVAYLNTVISSQSPVAITTATEPRQLLFALRHDLVTSASQPARSRLQSALFAVGGGGP